MRTVKNNGRKRVRLTQVDLDKIEQACGSRPEKSKSVFYEFGAPKYARFTEYVEGGHSAFIKSMRFRNQKNK